MQMVQVSAVVSVEWDKESKFSKFRVGDRTEITRVFLHFIYLIALNH